MHPKIRAFLHALLYPALYIFAQMASMLLCLIPGIIQNFGAVAQGALSPDEAIELALKNMDIQLSLMISLVAIIITVWLMRRRIWKSTSFCALKTGSGLTLPLCIMLGLATNFAILGIMMLVDITRYFPGYIEVMEQLTEGPVWMQYLNIILLAPIAEELIFRGTVIPILTTPAPNQTAKMFSPIAAAIIPAALFGLIHGNVVQGGYAFILGILLGLVFIWSGSIWTAIVVHMAFNATSMVLTLVPDYEIFDKPAFIFAVTLAASLAAGALMMVIYNRCKKLELERNPKNAANTGL
ncbi:MAG: CPBP family intramembrane metalloprotease [Clostridia bacterium]|nr:CPBP family intramembrane metalloprotease [Clostridia bacterium]